MIQPEPGAKLISYALDEELGGSGKMAPAYEELVLAVRGVPLLRSGWPDLESMSSDDEKAVLRFCSRYGLLGLLPHQVRSIALAPRQRKYVGDDGLPCVLPFQARYVRTAKGWRDETRGLLKWGFPDPGYLDLGYDAASLDDLADDAADGQVLEVPRATTRYLGQYDEEALEIEEAVAPYFPSIPKFNAGLALYPMPTSDPFWAMYAEPVHRFLRAALMLSRVFERLATTPAKPIQAELDSLVAPIMLLVEPGDRGVPVQKIATPSLLSALAVAAISAASKGVRLVRCPGCQILFFTDAYQTRYHEPKCAFRIHTRTYRANLKAKKEAEEAAKAREARRARRETRKSGVTPRGSTNS